MNSADKNDLKEFKRKLEEKARELNEIQAQLFQSEKMAALGSLMSGVAHEINTPVGALKSNIHTLNQQFQKLVEFISDPAVPEKIRSNGELNEIVQNIEEMIEINSTAVERIIKIVESLRNCARQDQSSLEEVNIHEGLDSTLTLIHHETKNRIEIVKEYGELPEIRCYPDQLNQIFMNLLVNAVQAIDGKGRIYIKTYTADKTAAVEIRDTGKGISNENLSRLFEPGFTTKESGVGTGLGLSIANRIVKDHNGKIEFESEVGRGTLVRIKLPIEQDD